MDLTAQEHHKIKNLIYDTCFKNGVSELATKVNYRFYSNMTRRFGIAYVETNFIKLSSILWQRASSLERDTVIVHEVCHIIAYHKFGPTICDHGEQWQDCMQKVGYKPERCHRVDITGLSKQYVKYEISCSCSSTWVGHTLAAKIRKRQYCCKHCKSEINLTGNSSRPKRN